ncbi:UDP-glucuronosyltransferase [Toxocara canis]|uniref:glucuronosyltransferase n=1 Tax=Toxocara canis TaxID=6265 RepID=A0A0B2W3N8_TOXCA|nr:UDP-glucuronosyltransferase [Toxocara canis]
MSLMVVSLLVAAIFLEGILSANILFWGMHSSISHIGSMLPLAKALIQSGHNVHFLQTTQNEKPFRFSHAIINHYFQTSPATAIGVSSIWTRSHHPQVIGSIYKLSEEAFYEIITERHTEMAKILNTTWDMIFADELIAVGSYGLALRNARTHKKPYIMFSTTVILHLFAWELALGRTFLTRPTPWTPFVDDIRFDVTNVMHRWGVLYDKIISGISLKSSIEYGENKFDSFDVTNVMHRWGVLYDKIISGISLKSSIEYGENKGLSMLGINDFSFTDLWKNAAYNFQQEIDYLAFPLPVSNDIINIGAHCPTANNLASDLANFIEDRFSKGTIYIAFGNKVRWADAPQSIIDAFKYMLNELYQYRIIIVDGDNSMGEFRSNVKVLKWAPQFDILNHNKTILFISHAGLKSLKEAICAKTPTLLIPVFAEQTHNAAVGVKLGFARSLSKLTLNGEKLLLITREMLTNNRYLDAVSRIHGIFLDRPIDTLQEAIFWTNRALRAHGRKLNFKRKGMSMSFLAYFYLPELSCIASLIAILCIT